jgi:phosphoribosylanthranilate isomerase
MKIKICGIKDEKTALFVSQLVDYIGFIFYKKSPRNIKIEKAMKIVEKLPPSIIKVGVFVNEDIDYILNVINTVGLTAVQLHGEETQDEIDILKKKSNSIIIKAIGINEYFNETVMGKYDVDAFLLDTKIDNGTGGTGKTFPWKDYIHLKKYGKIILAGGLNLENIGNAIRIYRPYGVDINSGVEDASGIKNLEKIENIVNKIKELDI